ncbi:MAG: hypothetical protein ACJ8CX_01750, partial [Microvirga sp.]
MFWSFVFVALIACGDEKEPSSPDPTARGDAGAGATHPDAAAPDGGSRGGGLDNGSGTNTGSRESCTAVPAHVRGFEGGRRCNYLCEKGYADCDGEIANGCEVNLAAPDACDMCPGMACLQPALCGKTEPVCQSHSGQLW